MGVFIFDAAARAIKGKMAVLDTGVMFIGCRLKNGFGSAYDLNTISPIPGFEKTGSIRVNASKLPDAFPVLFHSPQPPLRGKKRREEGEKRFFCEIAASGGTFCAAGCCNLALFLKSPPSRAGI
jgi:hypothetical protein